jgi:UDP-N-acetylglucosamine 2-epimerase
VKFVSIVGARPQFVKASPLSLALRARHREVLVHTGQHYDYGMSDVFFEELGIPAPDYHLGIGSGPHGSQTGAMLGAVEALLQKELPDAVLVYGDTNSTLAGALAAAKLHLPVAHIEAGLRSFNRAMPEEINRVITDHLSTWLFVPSRVAVEHLHREGIVAGVHVVGDVMIDAIELHRRRAEMRPSVADRLEVQRGQYYVATVHRAENTDDADRLKAIFAAFGRLDRPVLLPLHPRTRKRVDELSIPLTDNVRVLEPLGYLDTISVLGAAACLLTDSGGMQKEAYYLGVPCVTMRDETEWVETVEAGWNALAGADIERIVAAVRTQTAVRGPRPPLYGDGKTAQRIVEVLAETPPEPPR